jgi:hypothetical protein
MFIVFDLDGTLCDGSHKSHLLTPPSEPGGEWPEQDWGPWIEASIDDVPIEPLCEVAQCMIDGQHRVEFWTGRGEGMREVTQRWLDKHGLEGELRMRPLADPTTPDHIVKLKYICDAGEKPDLIFEDRASVVKMWRECGILCAQVAPGDF